MSNRIFAYAYLRAVVDEGATNPIDTLQPLILQAISGAKGKRAGSVDAASIKSELGASFDISVPVSVIEYVCRRLSSKKEVVFDKTTQGYIPNHRIQYFDDHRAIARSRYDYIVSCIQKEIINSESNMPPDQLLEDWLDRSALSFLGGGTDAYNASSYDYKINRIVHQCIQNFGNDFLSALTDVTIGDAIHRGISELTQYEADPEEASKVRQIQLRAVFDTPIVMGLFGLSSSFRNESSEEIIRMCRELGIQVCIFDKTIDEIEGIFAGAARNLRADSPVTGEIRHFIFRKGLTASEVIEWRRKFRALVYDRFELIRTPEISVELSIAESDLEHALEERVRQRYPEARKHDVDALKATYQLRGGRPFLHLEDAKYIFITSNKSVADSSTVFFQEMFRQEGLMNGVQVCMHTSVFASRLWIKLPSFGGDAPRKQIISQIHSALRPNKKTKDSFLTHLRAFVERGIVTDETAAFVEFSHFTEEILSERYHYDELMLEEGEARSTIDGVLKKLKSWKESVKTETALLYKNEIEELEALATNANLSLDASVKERSDIQEKYTEIERKLNKNQNRFELLVKVLYYLALFLIALCLFVIAILSSSEQGNGKVWGAVFAVIALAGGTIGDRIFSIRSRISNLLERFF